MNNIKPIVSVVMSVFNVDMYLEKSIKSILNQSLENFEFIIINDCSNDKSLEIIKKYQNSDDRIILLNNERNLGLPKSLNNGLEIARGKYIARQDADDISLKERLLIQYQFLEKHQDIFLIGSSAIIINEKEIPIKISKTETNPNRIGKLLKNSSCIYHPTIMFRNEQKYYRDKFEYSQDYDLYLRLITEGKRITNIKPVLVKRRKLIKTPQLNKEIQQAMFADKAKEFYHQRIAQQNDDYDLFEPKDIKSFDFKNHQNDKYVLNVLIINSFSKRDMVYCRKYIKRYFRYYKPNLHKIMLYLLSYLPTKLINLINKFSF